MACVEIWWPLIGQFTPTQTNELLRGAFFASGFRNSLTVEINI